MNRSQTILTGLALWVGAYHQAWAGAAVTLSGPSPSIQTAMGIGTHYGPYTYTLTNTNPTTDIYLAPGYPKASGSVAPFTTVTNNCTLVPANGSCSFSLSILPTAVGTLSGAVSVDFSYRQPEVSSIIPSITVTGDPALSASATNLALSVTGRTLDGQASGQARTITLSNTGSGTAHNVALTYPTWPSGTTSSSTCGSTLAAGASCTITIIPGSQSTSNCALGTTASPGVITVSADDTTSLNLNVTVVDYGCIYQGGYVFSMTETADAHSSIGGSVAALTDQVDASAPPYMVWSSNGSGSTASYGSYDLIPGIDQTSTTSSGAPSFTDFSTFFANSYTNTLGLTSADFNPCNGSADGQCNTDNITAFYNYYKTNYDPVYPAAPPFTATVAQTPLSDYAAGVCQSYDDGTHTDWYLPAICEIGYDGTSSGSGCGTSSSPTRQNIQSNLVASNIGAFSLFYWSSTEDTLIPGQENVHAWVQYIPTSWQTPADKDAGTAGVRCVRHLTL